MLRREVIDAQGKPFNANGIRRADQRWSTFFTFTSPVIVPRAGLLVKRAGRWSIVDNTVGQSESAQLRAASNDVSVSVAHVQTLLGHESVVRQSRRLDFWRYMNQVACAAPFVLLTVEPLYETQNASFGSISSEDGLRMLVEWSRAAGDGGGGGDICGSSALVGLVDASRDGEWFGVEQDHAEWLDDVADDLDDNDDDNEDDNDDNEDDNDEASVDNSVRFQPQQQPQPISLVGDQCAMQLDLASESAPAHENTPRISIGTRLSIQLNDSAVAGIFSFAGEQAGAGADDHAAIAERKRKQKLFFHALQGLEAFTKRFPMRCAPTDVSQSNPVPPLDQRHGLQLSLYAYQYRAVHWLLCLEQREAVPHRSGYVVPAYDSVQYSHLPLRFANKKIFLDEQSVELNSLPLDVRGGIVAAKTGTGKTTMMIAAVHLQHCFEQNIARRVRLPEQRAEIPPNRLAPRWSRVDQRKWVYANCTLVLCPRQMVQQWIDEFRKTLVPNRAHPLRIEAIRSVKDVRRLTIEYVQDCVDVLIVNKEIFKSPAYRTPAINSSFLRVFSGELKHWATSRASKYNYWDDDEARISRLMSINTANALQNVARYPRGSIFTTLLLHAVWWRRIVIDEVHELDSSWTMVERAVSTLQSDHTHGLTATPDFDTQSAFGYARDRRNVRDLVQIGYPALLNIGSGRDLLASDGGGALRYNFTHLHTITSSDTVGMPIVHMHKVDVTLTPTEYAVYSSIRLQDLKRRLLFCSHHVLDDEQWQQLLRSNADDDDDNDDADGLALGGSGAEMLSVDQVANAMQASRKRKMTQFRAKLVHLRANKVALQRETLQGFEESDIFARLVDIYGADDMDSVASHMERFASLGTVYVCRVTDDDRQDAKELALKEQQHEKQVALSHDVQQARVKLSAADKATLRRQIEMGAEHIKSVADEMRPLARKLRDCEREYNFFEAVFNRLSNPDQVVVCPICMDGENTKAEVVLTSCGHEFCDECSRGWFARSRRCPACRATLNVRRDLRKVDRLAVAPPPPPPPPAPKQASSSSSSTTTTTADAAATDAAAAQAIDDSRYGSKVAALLRLIATLRGRRDFRKLVIYAQFERLLKLVVEALKECGEEVLMVRGSAVQCQKAIDRFKNDSRCKIIVLSSENTISGVHLTEANHLIALHPILGTREEAFAKHWQAIGRIRRLVQRRTCHIWSLVTRNTCEQTMYAEQTVYAKQMHRRDLKIVWHD